MLREIAFRDLSDPHYKKDVLEVNSELESLLSQIRMIMFTTKGEVLGEPSFGLDLEDQLFNFDINEGKIRDDFYAQLAQFVLTRKYKIDIEFDRKEEVTGNTLYIYITIDGQRVMGVVS